MKGVHLRTGTEGMLTDHDLYLFNEGTHSRLSDKLGAHPVVTGGRAGTYFAVWAPNADHVTVAGDFNGWDSSRALLFPRKNSGIWEGFIPGAAPGARYKYRLRSRADGREREKADPFALHAEVPPKTASVIWNLDYAWNDGTWMKHRKDASHLRAPFNIYEVHLGSWMRVPEEGNRSLTYREIAPKLAAYAKTMGFTHVEFLPLMEHPFYGSWGYQVTGYFAPTSRYGTPQDFMALIDHLHQNGLGVILDWVPSHFPSDAHGLSFFDGTCLYEHADPKQGYHPDWKSSIFNYGRHEVRSFLISSALFWLDTYHADALRVDGVASMLYLDYSRSEGEWVPNAYGGRENLDAIGFLRRFNETVFKTHPDVQTMAEESTAWPMVSRPTYVGGLGFGMKWDMGWMHDTLVFLGKDPIYRKFHHHDLTFRMLYAFNENFVLPLSHDEVVHGKGSLMNKMAGDDGEKFASLRLLYGYMYGMPGKKLLFMGDEFGQWTEWNHDGSLDWHALKYGPHRGVQKWVQDAGRLYTSEKGLHEWDCDPRGFEWVDCNDAENNVVSFLRRGEPPAPPVLVVCNFTPVPRLHYRTGVPTGGLWKEVLNSDARDYGGSGLGNAGGFAANPAPAHGKPYSLNLTLPPLSCLFFKGEK